MAHSAHKDTAQTIWMFISTINQAFSRVVVVSFMFFKNAEYQLCIVDAGTYSDTYASLNNLIWFYCWFAKTKSEFDVNASFILRIHDSHEDSKLMQQLNILVKYSLIRVICWISTWKMHTCSPFSTVAETPCISQLTTCYTISHTTTLVSKGSL